MRRWLIVVSVLLASCGDDSAATPSGGGAASESTAPSTSTSLSTGDGLNTDGDAVCGAMTIDLDVLAGAQFAPFPALEEIEREVADARFLNVPQASGCFAGFAEPGTDRRVATMEAYTWPTSVIDATSFAAVFADRQPDRFRDEPHTGPGDVAHLMVVERAGEPTNLIGLVAEQGVRVVWVQSSTNGLDPVAFEQVAAAVLAGM